MDGATDHEIFQEITAYSPKSGHMIAFRQMKAMESIAESLLKLANPLVLAQLTEASDTTGGRPSATRRVAG